MGADEIVEVLGTLENVRVMVVVGDAATSLNIDNVLELAWFC